MIPPKRTIQRITDATLFGLRLGLADSSAIEK
jgi:hypothetical protein